MSKQLETSQTKCDLPSGDSKVSIKNFVEEVGELINQLSAKRITEAINHICDELKRIVAQKHDDFDQCNNSGKNIHISTCIIRHISQRYTS